MYFLLSEVQMIMISDDIFKSIFMDENVHDLIQIPLKFVPKGPIDNLSPLIQVMSWCQTNDKWLNQ